MCCKTQMGQVLHQRGNACGVGGTQLRQRQCRGAGSAQRRHRRVVAVQEAQGLAILDQVRGSPGHGHKRRCAVQRLMRFVGRRPKLLAH